MITSFTRNMSFLGQTYATNGWLLKAVKDSIGRPRKRFFILKAKIFSYFLDPFLPQARGHLDMNFMKVVEPYQSRLFGQFGIRLVCRNISGKDVTWYLFASAKEEQEKWLLSFSTANLALPPTPTTPLSERGKFSSDSGGEIVGGSKLEE